MKKRIPVFGIGALFVLAGCQVSESEESQHPSPTPSILEEVGIRVRPEENRACSFTDKKSGYFYATTHTPDTADYFIGWNIGRKRIFRDYQLYSGQGVLQRAEAAVTVYPHALDRIYPQAKETLILFDQITALGIFLQPERPDPIAIQLDTSLCRFKKADHAGIWFSPLEAPEHFLLTSPRKERPFSSERDLLTTDAQAGGFFLVYAISEEEALQTLETIRQKEAQLLAERKNRMEGIARQAHPGSSQDSLDYALVWQALTLDQLITQQQGWGIYAGLPWFNDYWGRDMFISLPGACLVNGQFDIARKILFSFAQFQNTDPGSSYFGRIPNRARPDEIIYNTADGTPRFVIQILEYVRYSGDTSIIRQLYPAVKRSMEGALKYWVDEKGYLCHDDADTWMDAKIKGKIPYSPRGNRANDIQALWVKQLRAAAFFARWMGETDAQQTWNALADQVALQFAKDFWFPDKGYLADRLDKQGKPDLKMRPNQLFALDLISNESQRNQIARTVWENLVYPWGVASLNQKDPDFHPYHEHWNYYHKDEAYHNGTVWLWTNGIAMQRLLEADQTEVAYQLFARMNRQALTEGAVGSLSENADALPKPGASRGERSGTFLQAWSNAEQLRIWNQYFLGVQPDLTDQRVVLRPRIPEAIQQIQARFPVGNGAINLAFSREKDGSIYAYSADEVSITCELDLPEFEPVIQPLQKGEMLWVKKNADRLDIRIIRNKKEVKSFRQPLSTERLKRLSERDVLLKDIRFCQPYLQPGLKCLRVFHDPPLTY
ncbi:MAG: hypothetical protein IPH16_12080 [Haliscomenobacter sp.]|nr:hypothetical protein [Haliscomenobacter sp.]